MKTAPTIFKNTCVAALAALAPAVWAQPPSKTVTFTDNFASGPSALWNNYAGNWTASGGQYFAQVPDNNPLTYTGLPFDLTDYTLTVTTVAGDGGIWLRSTESSPYNGDSVLLVLGGGGSARAAAVGMPVTRSISPLPARA
jgi:hypothetical protein